MAASEKVKRIVWVRAGGRCVLCRSVVQDESISPVGVGEVAHAAGQGSGPTTPRLHEGMPQADVDHPDNLLLLCRNCHKKIDDRTLEDVYTVERLLDLKTEHEKQVHHLLSLMDSSRTLVLRMFGDVRGHKAGAERLEIGAATAARGRVPEYLPRLSHSELEIDLTGVDENDPNYWKVQRRAVERGVAEALHFLRENADVDHMSVFAFARLPLLVLLGWLLDDTIRVDVAQRSRATAWLPTTGSAATFVHDLREGEAAATEAVLVLGLSGTPDVDALPEGLSELPRVTLSPRDAKPDVNIADREANRQAFDNELRRVLGILENRISRGTLHLVAAAPISMAIMAGRAIDPQVFPTVKVYDLGDDGMYGCALELTRPTDGTEAASGTPRPEGSA